MKDFKLLKLKFSIKSLFQWVNFMEKSIRFPKNGLMVLHQR